MRFNAEDKDGVQVWVGSMRKKVSQNSAKNTPGCQKTDPNPLTLEQLHIHHMNHLGISRFSYLALQTAAA